MLLQRLSCFVSLAVFAVPALPGATTPDSRFGAMTHFAQGWDTSWVGVAAAKSIGTVRDELYWEAVEPRKGVYTFPASYDAYMAKLKAANISPLIVLSFENSNYDGGMTP